jgi:hypothetical protein
LDPNQPTPNSNTSQPVDLAAGVSATPNSTPIPVSTPGFNPISAANETAAQADNTVNPSMNLLSTDPGGSAQEVQGVAATPEGMQIPVPAEEPPLEPLVNSTPEATANFMTPPAPEPEPTPEPVVAEATPVDVAADMSAIAPTPDAPPAVPTSGTMTFQTPLQSQSEIVNPGIGDAPPEEPPSEKPSSGNFRRWWPAGVALALFLAIGAGAYALFGNSSNQQAATKPNSAATTSNSTTNYNVTSVPLSELVQSGALSIGTGSQLNVNGQLRINDSAVLVPTTQPSNPQTGQLWLNSANNQLYYYNGSAFVPVADDNTTVKSIGGSSGTLAVGSGLSSAGNILQNTGVLSVQGQTGTVNFSAGGGITLNGTVISTTALPANQLVLGTGASGFSAVAPAASSGLCLLSTPGAPVFGSCTGAATVNTLNGLSGTVTISVGTGLSLAGSSGNDIQISSTGGTGVTSLNGQSGALTVDDADVTGVGSDHITIRKASDTVYGLVKIDNSNIIINGSNQITTSQDLRSTANVSFASLTLGSPLTVANGGTGVDATNAANGKLLIGDGTGFTLGNITSTGNTVSVTNNSGNINLEVGGLNACSSCANLTLSNLTPGGVALGTSLLPAASTYTVDLGAAATPFRDLYLGSSAGNVKFDASGVVGSNTLIIPNASGTICITGTICSGYQAAGSYLTSAITSLKVNAGAVYQGPLVFNDTADVVINDNGSGVITFTTPNAGVCSSCAHLGTVGTPVNQDFYGRNSFNAASSSNIAFQIQDQTGAGNLFIGDTTGKRIFINQAPTSITDVRLQVKGAIQITADNALPAQDIAHNGTIYYDPNGGGAGIGKFQIIEDGIAKTLCNTTNQGCGAGANQITLQGAYDNGNGSINTSHALNPTTPKNIAFDLDATSNSSFIVDLLNGSTGKAAIQYAGNDLFAVNSTGVILGNAGADGSLLFNSQNTAFTTKIVSGSPTSNITLRLPNDDGGINDCLKSDGSGVLSWGTCVSGGSGGGITGTGTATFLPVFDAAQNLTNSIISQPSSSNINIGGTLAVTDGNSLVLGTSSVAGKTGAIVFKNETNGNTVTLQSGSGVNAPGTSFALSLPVADSAGCLKSDGAGQLSFTTCLTGSGSGGGVSSLNGNSGPVTITGDAGNGLLVSGTGVNPITVTLAQDIQTTASPTFSNVIATSEIKTGGSGGTTRIDATGNLVNIGNLTGAGPLTVSAGGTNSNLVLAKTGTGNIVLSGFNCSSLANGGKITADASGNLSCSNDAGVSANTVSTSTTGTNGRLTKFTASNTIADSILDESGNNLTIQTTTNPATLTASDALTVSAGGTNKSLTLNASGSGAINIGNAGTGSILFAGGTGSTGCTITTAGVLTCDGTINSATLTGGSLSSSAVNSLNVGANAISTSSGNLEIDASGTGTIDIGANSTGNILLGGGFASTGCTLTNSTGAFACTSTINSLLLSGTSITGSGSLTVAPGGANSDLILAKTGSGNITLSGFDCTSFTNGGKITTNASGNLICSNDSGVGANTVSTSATGTSGRLAKFTAGNTIADSILNESGNTITLQTTTNPATITATDTLTLSAGGTNKNLILAKTGSGNIVLSGFNCTSNANGGKITADASGNLTCADDSGVGASTVSTSLSGTNGRLTKFTGANTIADSILSESSNTITLQTATNPATITASDALTVSAGVGKNLTLATANNGAGNSGAVSIDSGTASGTAGNISIGTGAYAHNVTVGNSSGGSALNLQSGSGNINLNPSGSNNTGVIVKPGTDSTSAFQVQSSSGNSLFNVNTGGANLLANGDFETNATGWTPTSGTFTRVVGPSAFGSAYGSANSLTNGNNVNVSAGLAASTQYTFSFYAKGTASLQISLGGSPFCNISISSPSSWTRYTCTGTTGGFGGNVIIWNNSGSTVSFQIDGAKVEAGPSATDYRSVVINDTPLIIQNAAGTALLTTDAAGGRIAIGQPLSTSYMLDVAGDINVTTGKTYRINGLDINAAGTLSNVAYLNGNNAFTGNNTYAGTSTLNAALMVNSTSTLKADSYNALSVQNTSGTSILNVDTTGGNLLANGDFETNATGWTPTSGTFTRVVGPSAFGSAYGSANSLTNGNNVNVSAGLAASTQYTFSFYAKGTASLQISLGGSPFCNISISSPSSWTRYTCTGTTGGFGGNVIIWNNSGSTVSFQIDGAKVEAGPSATPFQFSSLTVNAATTFKPLIYDNISALQVQNTAGTTLFNVDTVNSKIGTVDQTAASTNSVALNFKSGDASGATSSSGAVTVASGTGTSGSGAVAITSGNATAGASGATSLQTGTGTTGTGILTLQTGSASAGTSGTYFLQSGAGTTGTGAGSLLTGNASAGASGTLTVQTGTGSSTTGGITIKSGNAAGGVSGNIVIDVGTASTTAGTVSVGTTNATNVIVGNASGSNSVTLQSGTGGISASSTSATGTGVGITANSLTTGNAVNISSNSAGLSSGNMLNILQNPIYTLATTVSGSLVNATRSTSIAASPLTKESDSGSFGMQGTGNGATVTWTPTISSQPNRALVVTVITYGNSCSASFNGSSIGAAVATASNGLSNVSYYLLKMPTSGSSIPVGVSCSGGANPWIANASIWYNVDQTTAYTAATAGTTSLSQSTNVGDALIGSISNLTAGPGPTGPTGATASLNSIQNFGGSLWGASAYAIASGSPTTLSYSLSGGTAAMGGIVLRQAPATAITVNSSVGSLSSNCTLGANTSCADSGSILNLNQQYASATGAVLKIQNAGAGPDISLGNGIIRVGADSTTALRLQNAAGTGNNVFVADTTNRRIGVNLAGAPSFTIDAGGDINISTGSVYRINGVQIASSNLSDGASLVKLGSASSGNASTTLTQTNTTTDGITLQASQTTGKALVVNANALTTGGGLNVSTTSGLLASGNLVAINQTNTVTSALTNTGSLLNVSRAVTANPGNSPAIANTSSSNNSAGGTCTWAQSISGSANRLLIVNAEQNFSNPLATGVTYAGQAMTAVPGTFGAWWYMKEGLLPAAGSYNVIVSGGSAGCSSGTKWAASAWSGVDQTTSIGTTGNGGLSYLGFFCCSGGPDPYQVALNTTPGDVVTDIASVFNAYGALGGGQTQMQQNTSSSYFMRTSYKTATTSSTTVQTGTNGGGAFAYTALVLKQAATPTVTTSGALASLSSNCTVTTGACADTANILNLNQQYAGATGAVLSVQNASTAGAVDLLFSPATTAQIQTVGGTSTFGVNIQSGVATAGASGAVSLASGNGTTGTGALTASTGNASAGISGAHTISTGTGTTGTGAITIVSGNSSTSGGTSGAVTIDSGSTNAGTSGNIYIGNTNAKLVQVGNSSAALGSWTNTVGQNMVISSVNQPRNGHGTVVYNGYVYVVGGQTGTLGSTATNTVMYAKLRADGTIPTSGVGIWANANAISVGGAQNRTKAGVVASNGYLYVIGGVDAAGTVQSTVYAAKINSDGSLGTWTSVASPGVARENVGTFAANGYIYAVGGSSTTANAGAVSTVYYARQNADGTLGAWTTTQPIGGGSPVNRRGASVVNANGFVYVIGGVDAAGTVQSTVYYAKLNTDGTIPSSGSGVWATTNAVVSGGTQERAYASAVVSNGNIYLFGGTNTSTSQAGVYSAPFNGDGSLGTWSTQTSLWSASQSQGVVTANGYFYHIGGYYAFGATTYNTVYITSTPRVKVAGNLDLIGTDNSGLAEGGGGGQLTAGNTRIVGTLEVGDQANFIQGVSIGGNLTVGGKGTNASPIFAVQNSNGDSLFTVDSANNNISIGANNAGAVQAWQTSSSTGFALRDSFSTATANGFVYVIGGLNAGSSTGTVQYSKLGANGNPGNWTTTVPLPGAAVRNDSSAAVYNGYLYVTGGSTDNSSTNAQNSVFYTKLNPDGTVGAWATSTNPIVYSGTQKRWEHTTIAYNGFLYVIGGRDENGNIKNTVYYSKLNADGSNGTWSQAANLSTGVANHSTAVANGYVYSIGGDNGAANNTVQYAKLNLDGTTSAWTPSGNTVPQGRAGAGTAIMNGYIYYIAGRASGDKANTSYAQLAGDGSVGAWSCQGSVGDCTGTTPVNNIAIPNNRAYFGENALGANGYLYVIGGTQSSTVYYTSTPRVTVGGSLDLVGAGGGKNLSEGGTGGNLTAGDTHIVGSFEVQGQASFAQGVGIAGSLNVGGDAAVTGTLTVTGATTLGTLSVGATTVTGNLTVNGRIISGGSAPSAVAQSGAGTSGTCSISGGNDTAGTVSITTGSGSWAAGAQCIVTFNGGTYGAAPRVVISPTATGTAAVQPYVTSSATTFTINFDAADTSAHTFTFNYFVIK